MKLLYTLLIVFFASTQWSNAQMITVTNSTAPAGCDGTAYFNQWSSYNAAPWTWNWYQDSTLINSGDTSIVNLCAGTYTFELDSAGVIVYTTSFSINDMCSGFTVSTSVTNTYPNTCTGAITMTPSGGTAPYAYTWSNGVTTQNQANLCAGTYMFNCVDANGCSVTSSATVLEYGDSTSLLTAYVYAGYDYNGDCQGIANVYPVGGTEPYTILWSNGDTGEVTDSLCAGIYSVTVWDAAGDTTTNTFAVTDPSTTYGGNPYLDSIPVNDPYSYFIENCIIDYNAIDSAALSNAIYDSTNQNLYVVWEVYSGNGVITYFYDTLSTTGTPGVYFLSITVYCPAKSGEQYFGITGAIYLNPDGTLSVTNYELQFSTPYPNPFTGEISLDNTQGLDCTITLADATGRIVATERSAAELIQLNELSSLNTGTYFLTVSTEKGNKTWKLIR
jgi:hypothetical protein